MREVDEVIGEYSGHSRNVLEFCRVMKRLVDTAKLPGFSTESWAPLGGLIAVDEFERIGNFKETMNWAQYSRFLTDWARTSDWRCVFKRITEVGNLVFVELEEHSRIGSSSNVVNSMTLYEFDRAGKIRHLDVYLQMALPDSEMLKTYAGAKASV